MSISQAMCTSFKVELLDEQHDLIADTLKIALFTSSASFSVSPPAVYPVPLISFDVE